MQGSQASEGNGHGAIWGRLAGADSIVGAGRGLSSMHAPRHLRGRHPPRPRACPVQAQTLPVSLQMPRQMRAKPQIWLGTCLGEPRALREAAGQYPELVCRAFGRPVWPARPTEAWQN